MLCVYVEGFQPTLTVAQTHFEGKPITVNDLYSWAHEVLSIPKDDVYFVYNGKKLLDSNPIRDGVVRAVPRLIGGKGGFGSMLRAIGAQIEKTTNREACRDLSGRRLRDINEEQRLKNWISKKADREREVMERKKKKLEKLRSEPKIEFSDKKYEEERSKLSDVVHDAVEKGFQASSSASGSSSGTKRPVRKGFMFEEEEISDDSSDSSSDEKSGSVTNKQLKRTASESDSEEPSPAKRQHMENLDNASTSDDSADESGSEESKIKKLSNTSGSDDSSAESCNEEPKNKSTTTMSNDSADEECSAQSNTAH